MVLQGQSPKGGWPFSLWHAGCYTVHRMKIHHVQKAAHSRTTCEARQQPTREVQCHENAIGASEVARAWYVKTEDGKLHGQFHSEAAADWFAYTHDCQAGKEVGA